MSTDDHRPGRKLHPKVTSEIVNCLKGGMTVRLACMWAGISERTYRNWRTRGREEGAAPEYRAFLEATDHAVAWNARRTLATVTKASIDGNWKAAAWLLERRHGYEPASKRRHEISGPKGDPVKTSVDLTGLSTEQLRAIMRSGDPEVEE